MVGCFCGIFVRFCGRFLFGCFWVVFSFWVLGVYGRNMYLRYSFVASVLYPSSRYVGFVDVRSKLSAIELLGKYRDYYKSVDRDIRVIIESAQPASVSVDGGGVGVIPDGVEINGKSLLRFLNGSFLSSGTGGSTEVFFARGQFLWMRGAVSVGLYDSAAFSQ